MKTNARAGYPGRGRSSSRFRVAEDLLHGDFEAEPFAPSLQRLAFYRDSTYPQSESGWRRSVRAHVVGFKRYYLRRLS